MEAFPWEFKKGGHNMKKTVFLTGATGNMGSAAFKELYKRRNMYNIVLLIFEADRKKADDLYKDYYNDPAVRIVWGDLTNYEDVLEYVRDKAKLGDRTAWATWKSIADQVSVEYKAINLIPSDASDVKKGKEEVKKALSEGNGVLISLFNYKGHIVRLQEIREDGIVIDDPYGKLANLAVRDIHNKYYGNSEYKNGYKNSRNGDVVNGEVKRDRGEDVFLSWNDLNITERTTVGGEIESTAGDQVYVSTDKDTKEKIYKDFSNYISTYKVGYKKREEKVEEKKQDGTKIYKTKTYYRSMGAKIKGYIIFSK